MRSWTTARLDSVAELCLGKMLDKAKNRGEPKPYLRNVNVRWGRFDLDDVNLMPFEAHELARYSVRRGDLVVCEGGEPGRCAVWLRDEPFYIQKALHRVRCSPKLLPQFLAFQVEHLRDNGRLKRRFTGSTIQHLPGEVLSSLDVTFPPLPEQHRIVAEIDTQFTRLDAAVATLERVKVKLKRGRASVLKAAVEGRLVPTEAYLARSQDRTYEPASVLLARVLMERKAKWPKGKKYVEPAKPDTEGLAELPEGWVWATVDMAVVAGPINGLYAPARDYGSGTPILRITDFQDGWSRATGDLQSVRVNQETASKYGLSESDLVVNRVNSMTHLGKCMVTKPKHHGVLFESNMMRMTLSRTVTPAFVEYWLRSAAGRKVLVSNAKWAVNQASINQTDVCSTALPLPPLAEQHRIVAEVDRRLSVLDALDTTVAHNLQKCARLRQSILKRAFEGKLVPQAPGHPPVDAGARRAIICLRDTP